MPKTKWTLEVLQAEANKYSYRTEFAKGSPNAYAAAARKKLLDKICAHMKNKERDATSRRIFDEEQAQILAKEYKSGASMRELGEKYGTNSATILHTLRRLDVETRGFGDHQIGNYKYSKEEEDGFINEYLNSQVSMTMLAQKYGTTVLTIAKIFRRRGVKLKEHSAYTPKPKNLIGKVFGRLKVVDYAGATDGKTEWFCLCECGKSAKRKVRANNLLSGISKSCGCLGGDSTRKDLVGKKFGRLTVISLNKSESIPKRPKWNCRCECGREPVVFGDLLRCGNTKSCGCLKAEGYSVYDNPEHQQKREKEHIKLLNKHGRVELAEAFKGANHIHQYRCLEHDELHPAIPKQVLRGDGLYCCRIANNQFDSLDKAINGDLRAACEEEWLYIYEMARFPDLVKIGISNNPAARAGDVEYGDEISSWLFEERVDAYIVEQSIHHQTITAAKIPDELTEWAGWLEVRQLEKDESKDIAQFYIDEFYELGRWEFALAYAPLTDRQKRNILEKYFE
tara:strand:+ start:1820 stop:3349 length:1530 start_codon:yes stop_codon:yes gene_type:complete